MGKGWTIDEFVIVSEHYSKNYYKCKFKIDSKGKFNPTKAATGTMDSFYKGCEKALKEQGHSRTSNAVAKKEPEWADWTRTYKKSIEQSGGESVVGRRYSFIPVAKQDVDEDKCSIIMENFYAAFGNSPKIDPEVVEGSLESAKQGSKPPPLSTNDINLKLVNSLDVLVHNMQDDVAKPILTPKELELESLLKKSQIYSQLKAGGMNDELAMNLSGLK